MSADWPLPANRLPSLVRTICLPAAVNSIRQILQALQVAALETQDRAGVSAAQLFVLGQFEEHCTLSINQLAERTMTDRQSVAAVVDQLVARRLARRQWSGSDRGQGDVTVTSAGRDLLLKAPEAPTVKLLHGLAQLSDNELYALAAGLSRLQQELGLEKEPVVMLFENGTNRP